MGLGGGGNESAKEADALWGEVEPILRLAQGGLDGVLAAAYSPTKASQKECDDSYSAEHYDSMLAMLLEEGGTNPFYDELTKENKASIRAWIERWHMALTECYARTLEKSEDGLPRGFRFPRARQSARGNERTSGRRYVLWILSSSEPPGTIQRRGPFPFLVHRRRNHPNLSMDVGKGATALRATSPAQTQQSAGDRSLLAFSDKQRFVPRNDAECS